VRFLKAKQARNTPADCARWVAAEPNVTRDEVAGGGFAHDRYEASFLGGFDPAVDALIMYRVFAPWRMQVHVCTPDRRVAVGAIIVQRVILGPAALETAVRVIELDRAADRVHLAYATLPGHPERGVASFAVTRRSDGNYFEAQAWSRAGLWLTALGRPVSRLFQRAVTREALRWFCSTRVTERAR